MKTASTWPYSVLHFTLPFVQNPAVVNSFVTEDSAFSSIRVIALLHVFCMYLVSAQSTVSILRSFLPSCPTTHEFLIKCINRPVHF